MAKKASLGKAVADASRTNKVQTCRCHPKCLDSPDHIHLHDSNQQDESNAHEFGLEGTLYGGELIDRGSAIEFTQTGHRGNVRHIQSAIRSDYEQLELDQQQGHLGYDKCRCREAMDLWNRMHGRQPDRPLVINSDTGQIEGTQLHDIVREHQRRLKPWKAVCKAVIQYHLQQGEQSDHALMVEHVYPFHELSDGSEVCRSAVLSRVRTTAKRVAHWQPELSKRALEAIQLLQPSQHDYSPGKAVLILQVARRFAALPPNTTHRWHSAGPERSQGTMHVPALAVGGHCNSPMRDIWKCDGEAAGKLMHCVMCSKFCSARTGRDYRMTTPGELRLWHKADPDPETIRGMHRVEFQHAACPAFVAQGLNFCERKLRGQDDAGRDVFGIDPWPIGHCGAVPDELQFTVDTAQQALVKILKKPRALQEPLPQAGAARATGPRRDPYQAGQRRRPSRASANRLIQQRAGRPDRVRGHESSPGEVVPYRIMTCGSQACTKAMGIFIKDLNDTFDDENIMGNFHTDDEMRAVRLRAAVSLKDDGVIAVAPAVTPAELRGLNDGEQALLAYVPMKVRSQITLDKDRFTYKADESTRRSLQDQIRVDASPFVIGSHADKPLDNATVTSKMAEAGRVASMMKSLGEALLHHDQARLRNDQDPGGAMLAQLNRNKNGFSVRPLKVLLAAFRMCMLHEPYVARAQQIIGVFQERMGIRLGSQVVMAAFRQFSENEPEAANPLGSSLGDWLRSTVTPRAEPEVDDGVDSNEDGDDDDDDDDEADEILMPQPGRHRNIQDQRTAQLAAAGHSADVQAALLGRLPPDDAAERHAIPTLEAKGARVVRGPVDLTAGSETAHRNFVYTGAEDAQAYAAAVTRELDRQRAARKEAARAAAGLPNAHAAAEHRQEQMDLDPEQDDTGNMLPAEAIVAAGIHLPRLEPLLPRARIHLRDPRLEPSMFPQMFIPQLLHPTEADMEADDDVPASLFKFNKSLAIMKGFKQHVTNKLLCANPVYRRNLSWFATQYDRFIRLRIAAETAIRNSGTRMTALPSSMRVSEMTPQRAIEEAARAARSDTNLRVDLPGSASTLYRTAALAQCLVQQYGPPSKFLTFTQNDNWPEMQFFRAHCDLSYLESGTNAVRSKDRCTASVVSYHARQQAYRAMLHDPVCSPIGKVTDSFSRLEFQSRSTSHSHLLAWTDRSVKPPYHMIVSTAPHMMNFAEVEAAMQSKRRVPPVRLKPTGDARTDAAFIAYRSTANHKCSEMCYRVHGPGGGKSIDHCRFGFPHKVAGDEVKMTGFRTSEHHRSPQDVRLATSSPMLCDLMNCHVNLQHADSTDCAAYMSGYVAKAEDTIVQVPAYDEKRIAKLPVHVASTTGRVIAIIEMITHQLGYPTTQATVAFEKLDLQPRHRRALVLKSLTQLKREFPDSWSVMQQGRRQAMEHIRGFRHLVRDQRERLAARIDRAQANVQPALVDSGSELDSEEDDAAALDDVAVEREHLRESVDPRLVLPTDVGAYQVRPVGIPLSNVVVAIRTNGAPMQADGEGISTLDRLVQIREDILTPLELDLRSAGGIVGTELHAVKDEADAVSDLHSDTHENIMARKNGMDLGVLREVGNAFRACRDYVLDRVHAGAHDTACEEAATTPASAPEVAAPRGMLQAMQMTLDDGRHDARRDSSDDDGSESDSSACSDDSADGLTVIEGLSLEDEIRGHTDASAVLTTSDLTIVEWKRLFVRQTGVSRSVVASEYASRNDGRDPVNCCVRMSNGRFAYYDLEGTEYRLRSKAALVQVRGPKATDELEVHFQHLLLRSVPFRDETSMLAESNASQTFFEECQARGIIDPMALLGLGPLLASEPVVKSSALVPVLAAILMQAGDAGIPETPSAQLAALDMILRSVKFHVRQVAADSGRSVAGLPEDRLRPPFVAVDSMRSAVIVSRGQTDGDGGAAIDPSVLAADALATCSILPARLGPASLADAVAGSLNRAEGRSPSALLTGHEVRLSIVRAWLHELSTQKVPAELGDCAVSAMLPRQHPGSDRVERCDLAAAAEFTLWSHRGVCFHGLPHLQRVAALHEVMVHVFAPDELQLRLDETMATNGTPQGGNVYLRHAFSVVPLRAPASGADRAFLLKLGRLHVGAASHSNTDRDSEDRIVQRLRVRSSCGDDLTGAASSLASLLSMSDDDLSACKSGMSFATSQQPVIMASEDRSDGAYRQARAIASSESLMQISVAYLGRGHYAELSELRFSDSAHNDHTGGLPVPQATAADDSVDLLDEAGMADAQPMHDDQEVLDCFSSADLARIADLTMHRGRRVVPVAIMPQVAALLSRGKLTVGRGAHATAVASRSSPLTSRFSQTAVSLLREDRQMELAMHDLDMWECIDVDRAQKCLDVAVCQSQEAGVDVPELQDNRHDDAGAVMLDHLDAGAANGLLGAGLQAVGRAGEVVQGDQISEMLSMSQDQADLRQSEIDRTYACIDTASALACNTMAGFALERALVLQAQAELHARHDPFMLPLLDSDSETSSEDSYDDEQCLSKIGPQSAGISPKAATARESLQSVFSSPASSVGHSMRLRQSAAAADGSDTDSDSSLFRFRPERSAAMSPPMLANENESRGQVNTIDASFATSDDDDDQCLSKHGLESGVVNRKAAAVRGSRRHGMLLRRSATAADGSDTDSDSSFSDSQSEVSAAMSHQMRAPRNESRGFPLDAATRRPGSDPARTADTTGMLGFTTSRQARHSERHDGAKDQPQMQHASDRLMLLQQLMRAGFQNAVNAEAVGTPTSMMLQQKAKCRLTVRQARRLVNGLGVLFRVFREAGVQHLDDRLQRQFRIASWHAIERVSTAQTDLGAIDCLTDEQRICLERITSCPGFRPWVQNQQDAAARSTTGSLHLLLARAGCGKTFLLRALMAIVTASGMQAAVTATTGVAAVNIKIAGTTTLHRFLHMTSGGGLSPSQDQTRWNFLQSIDLIVVDECGMITAEMLNHLDEALRMATHTYRSLIDGGMLKLDALARVQPFGYRSVVLSGDVSQLPAIPSGSKAAACSPLYPSDFKLSTGISQGYRAKWYESRLWSRVKQDADRAHAASLADQPSPVGQLFDNPIITLFGRLALTENQRARGDVGFARMLGHVWSASTTEADFDALSGFCRRQPPSPAQMAADSSSLFIAARVATVLQRNRTAQAALERTTAVAAASAVNASPSFSLVTPRGELIRRVSMDVEQDRMLILAVLNRAKRVGLLSKHLAPHMRLCKGSRVTLTTNLSVENGIANGVQGTVLHVLKDKFLVINVKGRKQPIVLRRLPKLVPLDIRQKDRARRTCQCLRIYAFPVRLANCQTVHSCQGLTAQTISVDTTGMDFAAGSLYVSISRATASHGVSISLDPTQGIRFLEAASIGDPRMFQFSQEHQYLASLQATSYSASVHTRRHESAVASFDTIAAAMASVLPLTSSDLVELAEQIALARGSWELDGLADPSYRCLCSLRTCLQRSQDMMRTHLSYPWTLLADAHDDALQHLSRIIGMQLRILMMQLSQMQQPVVYTARINDAIARAIHCSGSASERVGAAIVTLMLQLGVLSTARSSDATSPFIPSGRLVLQALQRIDTAEIPVLVERKAVEADRRASVVVLERDCLLSPLFVEARAVKADEVLQGAHASQDQFSFSTPLLGKRRAMPCLQMFRVMPVPETASPTANDVTLLEALIEFQAREISRQKTPFGRTTWKVALLVTESLALFARRAAVRPEDDPLPVPAWLKKDSTYYTTSKSVLAQSVMYDGILEPLGPRQTVDTLLEERTKAWSIGIVLSELGWTTRPSISAIPAVLSNATTPSCGSNEYHLQWQPALLGPSALRGLAVAPPATPLDAPSGVQNRDGTSCFLAAAVQLLAASPAVKSFIADDRLALTTDPTHPSYGNSTVVQHLRNALQQLDERKGAISLARLRSALHAQFPDDNLAVGQHDCSQVLTYLLDSLQDVAQVSAEDAPDVLIVVANRFQTDADAPWASSKVRTKLQIEPTLDLGPVQPADDSDNQSLKYNLLSVVEHIGPSLAGGHYVATIHDPQGSIYFTMDDDRVCESAEFGQDSTIALYERSRPPPHDADLQVVKWCTR